MSPTALDDDPITAAWQAAQGGGGVAPSGGDDPIEAAWKAAQRKRPTAPLVAPRDVTATPASPQSAPVDIPDSRERGGPPCAVVRGASVGKAANLIAGVPKMLAHPAQVAEQAVTAIPGR